MIISLHVLMIVAACSADRAHSGPDTANGDVVFATRPFAEKQPFPLRLPEREQRLDAIRAFACPGEHEAATFCVFTSTGMDRVRVTVTDLQGPDGAIGAGAVDIRVVKWWYQGPERGGAHIEEDPLRFVPELLVKDDALIRNDHRMISRILSQPAKPFYDDFKAWKLCVPKGDLATIRDTLTLQPVTIPAGTLKQFWVTFRVPEDAGAGTYRGRIDVSADDRPAATLPVQIEVLPFHLREALLEYSIYYRGGYRGFYDRPKDVRADSDKKSEEQMEADIADMLAHGIANPAWYTPLGRKVEKTISLRRSFGISGPFYQVSNSVVAGENGIMQQHRDAVRVLRDQGIKEI